MRKFIFKASCFILAFGLLLILIVLANKEFASIKVDRNKTMLVLGHSHSECAFNDSLLEKAVNFSQSGEANFYTYFKLKKIIELNSQIDTVFIQFSNNQVDESMNDWTWDNMHMSYYLPKYALFMDREGLKLLYLKNPETFKRCIFPILKNNMRMIFKGFNYYDDLGCYRYLVRNKADSLLTASNDDTNEKLINLSSVNIEYLSRTLDFCRQKNIKVFLVRTPVHEKSLYFKNELLFQKILKVDFSGTEFLDFSKYPIANSEFADLEHLNYRGANKFSAWFAHMLEIGLLQSDNKQAFIDNKIRLQTNIRAIAAD